RPREIGARHRDECDARTVAFDQLERSPVGIVRHHQPALAAVGYRVREWIAQHSPAEVTDAFDGGVEVAHDQPEPLEAAQLEARRRGVDRSRLLPLEQVDGTALEAVRTEEDPRVPPRPVEPERDTALRVSGGGANAFAQTEAVRVEAARSLEIGA